MLCLVPTGVHEGGHRWAAKRRGVDLSLPFFIPAGLGLLGSFGSITRFKSPIPNRYTTYTVYYSWAFSNGSAERLQANLWLCTLETTLHKVRRIQHTHSEAHGF